MCDITPRLRPALTCVFLRLRWPARPARLKARTSKLQAQGIPAILRQEYFVPGCSYQSRLASIQDEDEVYKLSEYLYHVNMAEGGAEHFCMNSLLKPLLHDKYSGVYARAPLEDEDLTKLSMPCTIIFGDKDWMNNPKIHETFMPKVPNAEMAIVSQAGHHLYLDQPEQWIAIVKNALLNERPKGSAVISTKDIHVNSASA
ncbi:hypothetical protein CYMTET_40844 [Cymbomonas tetramitiformis]|uniref:AB hydrolase-1 domain-containing protein n=1 Tax=Cymbomonas tetramitiformis TaxID=36881 RepID=A0AAE0F355_9CHLO|nr:hypothetical protein CYMTET_40844 [Cymbomonas tetramitiformis]